MKSTSLCRNITATLLALALCQTALATQPGFSNVRVKSKIAFGSASFIEVTNLRRSAVTVTVQAGPLSTLPFDQQRVRVDGSATAAVNLGDLFRNAAAGAQALHVFTRVEYDNGRSEDGPALYEPLRVAGGTVTPISFDEAFVSRQKPVLEKSDIAEVDLGAGYVDRSPMPDKLFPAQPMDPNLPVIKLDVPALEDMIAMKPGEVGEPGPFEVDGRIVGGGAPRTLEPRAFAANSFAGPIHQLNPNPPDEQIDGTTEVTVTGRFFLKVIDPPSTEVNLPGWAWSARIWEFVGFWKYRGQGTVNSAGNWKAKVKLLDPQAQIRVTFQPVNRFVVLKKKDGHFWGWDRYWNLSNGTNTGDYSADFTANGDLPGLGQIYWNSMRLWAKLYTNGVNPLTTNPIPITYPNDLTTGKCTKDDDGTTIPWSCATSTGAIWIAPAHAFGGTAPHELAHSIHRHYWGQMPPGSGGPHDADKCYNPGLALSEGFANYIAYWTTSTQTSLDTLMRSGIDAESLPTEFCMGPANEFRVAAVMWDTYDKGSEVADANNADIWYYYNPAGFIKMFLKTQRNSIADYRAVLKGNNPASFQTEVDRLFRLNTIIP